MRILVSVLAVFVFAGSFAHSQPILNNEPWTGVWALKEVTVVGVGIFDLNVEVSGAMTILPDGSLMGMLYSDYMPKPLQFNGRFEQKTGNSGLLNLSGELIRKRTQLTVKYELTNSPQGRELRITLPPASLTESDLGILSQLPFIDPKKVSVTLYATEIVLK